LSAIDAVDYLVARGWSEPAAQAIAAHSGSGPPETMVPHARLGNFHDWCGMVERRRDYATSALAFLDYEFRDSFHGLGADLTKATTATEAAAAIAPYWGRGVPADA
jgi:hypothetical protein